MFIAYVVVAVITILINTAEAVANYGKHPQVLKNMDEVRVPRPLLPLLATLKAAGSIGLVIGLLWWPPLGIAAAVGFTVFYLCAVTVHLRTGVVHNIAFPIFFLATAAGTVALGLAH
ncbi:DoxX family protein [Nocardia crassostreae]|uniref:DoxX family protein n=1 Tax=Nocardia crassostreae TaxID=53428 RepID=UPI00082E93F8|nr:DoxX family protein [Nocardia crassostreae]